MESEGPAADLIDDDVPATTAPGDPVAVVSVPSAGAGFLPRWWLYVVPVAVGLVARVLYWVLVTPDWVPDSDADQYLRIARAIADGDGFALVFPQLEMHATAFRPPLYPYLLSVPSLLFGDDVLWPSRLLSLLLGLAVIGLTVAYVRRIAGRPAAFAAGLLVALLPSLIANDTVTLTEPLALALLLGLLIALLDDRWLLAGAMTGLLFLTRPNAYLVLLVVVVVIWRRLGWRKALLGAVTCAVVVTPWLIRNQVQVGTPRIVTSEGFNLAAMYGPPAREREGFVDPVFDDWYEGTDFKLLQFDEAEWNDRLTDLALDEIRSHPGYVAEVVRRNLLNVFELRTDANEYAERIDGRNVDFRRATLWTFYLVAVSGLVGLGIRIRDRRTWPALVIVGQFVLLSLLLVSPPRLRAPFDLLLCVGVGFLVGWIVDVRAQRQAARGAT